jgi:hypothetical protein
MQFSDAVAVYIMRYHTEFLTEMERRTLRHIVAVHKQHYLDEIVKGEGRTSKFYSEYISDDPEVLRLANDGYGAFNLKTAQRIFQQHSEELRFNCCPRCGGVARTPKARQCRFCHHDWHGDLV